MGHVYGPGAQWRLVPRGQVPQRPEVTKSFPRPGQKAAPVPPDSRERQQGLPNPSLLPPTGSSDSTRSPPQVTLGKHLLSTPWRIDFPRGRRKLEAHYGRNRFKDPGNSRTPRETNSCAWKLLPGNLQPLDPLPSPSHLQQATSKTCDLCFPDTWPITLPSIQTPQPSCLPSPICGHSSLFTPAHSRVPAGVSPQQGESGTQALPPGNLCSIRAWEVADKKAKTQLCRRRQGLGRSTDRVKDRGGSKCCLRAWQGRPLRHWAGTGRKEERVLRASYRRQGLPATPRNSERGKDQISPISSRRTQPFQHPEPRLPVSKLWSTVSA